MIVLLESSLFETPDDSALVSLIHAGRSRRHAVRTMPAFRRGASEAVNRWLASQGDLLREQLVLVLQEGLKELPYGGPGLTPLRVQVGRREAVDLSASPPRVPIHVAHDLIVSPLDVLLENGRSDWGFLRKIAPRDWHERLRRAIDGGWIEERNAGGITELPKMLQQDLAAKRHARLELRTWAMFDSDARQPGCPSRQSEEAGRACQEAGVQFHRLERRSIENYIPKEALLDWATRVQPEEKRGIARCRILAYFEMTDDRQRHHYSLKDGFAKDANSHWTCPGDKKVRTGLSTIYEGLRDDLRGILNDGLNADFNKDTQVTDIWRSEEYELSEASLTTECFDDERHTIFQSLFWETLMAVPSFFGEPRMPILSRLLAEIRAGEVLIPRFERPFVWTDDQRLQLLESVGYPIGAILVWRTQKHQLKTHDRLGPLILPGDDTEQRVRQYLIDGHQRLTTLFAALGEGLYTSAEEEVRRVEKGKPGSDRRWPIFFDLEFENDESTEGEKSPGGKPPFPFKLLRRGLNPPPTWLPLSILFDAYEVQERFTPGLPKEKRTKRIVNRIRAISEVFSNYPVPVMPIATEDIDQVTTSFKRVNSGGRKMTELHMVSALTYRHDFDLLERVEDLRTSLKPLGWNHLHGDMVLNVIKARLGKQIYDTRPEELATAIKSQPDVLERVREDIQRAVRTLDQIANVRGPAVLPYNYQLVLLADALRDTVILSDEQRSRLRLWFWATALGEYFRGISKSLFERAQKDLRQVVLGASGPLPPDVERTVYAFDNFDFRAARSRAFALLLAEQGPRDPDGAPIDAFALLAEAGADALSKLVTKSQVSSDADLRAVDGAENRFLVHPNHADRLDAWSDQLPLTPAAVLRSHAISEDAATALRAKEYGQFLRLRRKTLQQLEGARAAELGLEYKTEDEKDAD